MEDKDIKLTGYKLNKKAVTNLNKILVSQGIDLENGKVDLHHITSTLGSLENTMASKKVKNLEYQTSVIEAQNNGLKFGSDNVFNVTEIGINPDTGVVAFKVENNDGTAVISKNDIPHVTAFVPEGEKAFSSNKITEENWTTLENQIQIKATFTEFYKNDKDELIDAHLSGDVSKSKQP